MGQADDGGKRRPQPKGAAMSTKQMARTVQDGKKVHFRWHPDADGIEGYLCGMDDFHWMVVTPEGRTILVHKGSAPIIDIATEATLHDEPGRAALEAVITPFRKAMQREHNLRPVADSTKESA